MSKINFVVKASVAAVAASLAGIASAAIINMDSPATGSATTYASEQTISGTVALTGLNNASATTGASFGVDKAAFVRFDLTGGTFGSTAPSIDIDDNGGANGGSGSVSQGGASGDSYVIFQVSPASGNSITQNGTISFGPGSVSVTTNAGVSLRYRLYETLTAAVNQTTGTALKDKSVDMVAFKSAVTLSQSLYDGAQTSAVADVSATTGAYTAFNVSTTTGSKTLKALSKFMVKEDTTYLKQNGVAVSAGDIVADTNTLTVTGDFTGAQNDDGTYTGAALPRVYLATDNTCATAGAVNASSLSATTATWTGLTAAQLYNAGNSRFLCYQLEGTPSIPAASYTATLGLVAESGFSLTSQSVSVGSITRNGTVLKVPFFSNLAYTGNFVQLANTGTLAATYTTRCFGGASTTASGTAATGSIAAGATKKIYFNDLGCAASSNAVEFTVAVPAGNVVGTLVRQNATTGASAFSDVTGNASN